MKKILFALLCCFVLINSVNAYTTTSKYTYTTSQFTNKAFYMNIKLITKFIEGPPI